MLNEDQISAPFLSGQELPPAQPHTIIPGPLLSHPSGFGSHLLPREAFSSLLKTAFLATLHQDSLFISFTARSLSERICFLYSCT